MKTRYVLASLIVGSMLTLACEEKPSASPRGSTTPNNNTGTSAQSRAQGLIDQFNQHVRNNEYDAAESNLRELEGMKSDLPQTMQTQINQLRTRLDNAKAATTPPSGARSPSTANPPNTPPSTPPKSPPDEPPGS
jgi:TolA-binding protein